jgi:superfamily II DNA or RNA helicase
VVEYFGDTVFEFSLKKAIKTINPATGKTYLTPYVYKPYFVPLTDDELEQYEKETLRIAQAYSRTENGEYDELYKMLLMKRQNIVKNAQGKYDVFKRILDTLKVNHCLVYCSPQQITPVQHILNERNIIQHEFTMNEGTVPQKEYNNLSEREFLLKKFAEGVYDVLVAMKCLDEGVDVPPAHTAVILSSSGNPRQYIQRRGRVLRHYPGKKKATIYDIIVEPLFRVRESELLALEKRIFEKELKRYKEFAFDALNALECLSTIERMEEKCRW